MTFISLKHAHRKMIHYNTISATRWSCWVFMTFNGPRKQYSNLPSSITRNWISGCHMIIFFKDKIKLIYTKHAIPLGYLFIYFFINFVSVFQHILKMHKFNLKEKISNIPLIIHLYCNLVYFEMMQKRNLKLIKSIQTETYRPLSYMCS